MFCLGRKTNFSNVYEVEFEHMNVLTKKMEHRWEYVNGDSKNEVIKEIERVYGLHIDIINVEIDD